MSKKRIFLFVLGTWLPAASLQAGDWTGWTRVQGVRDDRKQHEIAVVFDGTESQYADLRRAYEMTVENIVTAVTRTEPFGQYENYFAVYRRDAAGAARPVFADTYVTVSPDMSVWPEYDATLRIVRAHIWTLPETFVHEFGHAIGGLADTYVGEGLAGYGEGRLPNIQNAGATRIDQVKWGKEWIPLGTPVPTPDNAGYGIGYYPIGDTGFYCPSRTSIMGMRSREFDSVDKQALVSRIFPICCGLPQRVIDAGRLVIVKDTAVMVPLRLDFLGLPSGDASARASFTFTGENGESVTRPVSSVDIPTDRFLRPGVSRIETLASFTSDYVRNPAVMEKRDYVNISWRNAAPTISEVGALRAVEGSALTVPLAVVDPNGDRLVCRGIGLPAGANVAPEGDGWILKWFPTILQGGRTYSFSVEVTDGHLAASTPVTVTVADSGIPVGFDASLEGALRGEAGITVAGDVETPRVARLALNPFPDVPVSLMGTRFMANIPGDKVAGWGDGARALTIDAYDVGGAFLGSARVDLRIDTTPPVVSIAQPFEGQRIVDGVTLTALVDDFTPAGAAFTVTAAGGKVILSGEVKGRGPDYTITKQVENIDRYIGKRVTLEVNVIDGICQSTRATLCFSIDVDRTIHVVD